MEMYLQYGHGMMKHSQDLVKGWGKGCVILSPRDLNNDQLHKVATDIRASGGSVLLDPQFYIPYSNHETLVSHSFWPNEYDSNGFWSGPPLTALLTKLNELNSALGCGRVILPGVLATSVDEAWLCRQADVQQYANHFGLDLLSTFATVALAANVVQDKDQIQAILEEGRKWNVGGIYLVCEHPNGDYLVQDPVWLADVLELVAGFRLQGKSVVLGYCNHQMLVAACCSPLAIASGTWMNVRSFSRSKFQVSDETIKRKATWYYCPQALSEYKIPMLDIAMMQGILKDMESPPELGSSYADLLFQGPQPSTVQFNEPMAFPHYLQCLWTQVSLSRRASFDDTVSFHNETLDRAEDLLVRLHSFGVRGQLRDFRECIDINRAALAVLVSHRGPMLRRQWAKL